MNYDVNSIDDLFTEISKTNKEIIDLTEKRNDLYTEASFRRITCYNNYSDLIPENKVIGEFFYDNYEYGDCKLYIDRIKWFVKTKKNVSCFKENVNDMADLLKLIENKEKNSVLSLKKASDFKDKLLTYGIESNIYNDYFILVTFSDSPSGPYPDNKLEKIKIKIIKEIL